jgi:pimeloyl-ACP methyl ester carboxylesterase
MTRDLQAYVKDHHLKNIVLLGHSMGGKTAMTYALLHPHHLRQLVVVDVSPRPHKSTFFPDLLRMLQDLDLSQFSSRSEFDAALRPHLPSGDLRAFLLKNLKLNPATGGYRWKVNLDSIAANLEAITGALPVEGHFDGPADFIRGGNSAYVTDEDIPLVHRFFPTATLHTVPGAGHWVHAEQPEKFMQILQDILRAGVRSPLQG